MNQRQHKMTTAGRALITLACIAISSTSIAQTQVATPGDTSSKKPATKKTADNDTRAKTLEAMQKAAGQFKLTLKDETKLAQNPEPIFRFDDPTRSTDGAIWAWGEGRPSGLTVIARDSRTANYWMVETVSFSETPLVVKAPLDVKQTLKGSFEPKKISDVDAPHTSAARRKLQLKMISKKFHAFQMWDNLGATEDKRFELRMLDKPVLEYSDKERGISNGAVFLFLYGMNPELAMVIEAHEDGWQCGFGRMGWASANVNFDETLIFEHPKIKGSDDRYLSSFINVPADELARQVKAAKTEEKQ